MTDEPSGKGRGFASMDEVQKREIASRGGKAAQKRGTAHKFTPEQAREAGRKGGKVRGKGGSGTRASKYA